ncbi:MAG: zinc ABC transporter substrate-binding protein [Sulfurovum sp.]|nr:MAG: zinc ABC transporter substrate-binding protein [Sulfurovum sp.]
MKKIITFILLSSSYLLSNIHVVVSIVPEQTFVKAIGGDKVDISVMVQAGDSPHTYEPKPSQMISMSQANLYFAIGVEFEKVWLPKFQDLSPNMHIVHLDNPIKKISIQQTKTTNRQHKHHEEEDPHIWTSPENVKIIAQNIYDTLAKYDAKNTSYYQKNLHTFLASITDTDTHIKQLLKQHTKNHTFMVFHPSWGYYAKAYHLKQIVIEVEGKSPKPKALVHLIQEAKAQNVKVIFTQLEFSDQAAKIIANELNISVIKVSPMAANWSKNLIFITKSIVGDN